MALDIMDKDTVHRIITDIRSEEIERRRTSELQAWWAYAGKLRSFVKNRLTEQFPEDAEVMDVSDIALNKKVVDKLSVAYREGVIRSVEGDDFKSETYNDISQDGKFDKSFAEFDKYMNLHKCAALWAVKREGQPIVLEPLAPYTFFPIIDQDTNQLVGMVLNYPGQNITRRIDTKSDGIDQIVAESQADSSAEIETYAMWTDTQHSVWRVKKKRYRNGFKTQVDYVPIDGNPNNVNPLGVLPFVYVSDEPSVELPILNPLTNQAITYNVLMSHALTAASRQGFGLMVIKHPEKKRIEKLHIGFKQAVKLPQPPPEQGTVDLSFENANPDLSGQLEVYGTYLKSVLAQHGITGSSTLGGDAQSFTSGLDRLIANADVTNKVEQNQSTYSDVEKDIFKIIKRILDTEDGRNPFEEEDELSVIYQKPKVMVSDSEQISNIKMLMDMGMLSRVDAKMKLDPNLTAEQAAMELEKIEEEKTARLSEFMNETTPQRDDEVLDERGREDRENESSDDA